MGFFPRNRRYNVNFTVLVDTNINVRNNIQLYHITLSYLILSCNESSIVRFRISV